MDAAVKPPWMGLRRPLKLDTESRPAKLTTLGAIPCSGVVVGGQGVSNRHIDHI